MATSRINSQLISLMDSLVSFVFPALARIDHRPTLARRLADCKEIINLAHFFLLHESSIHHPQKKAIRFSADF